MKETIETLERLRDVLREEMVNSKDSIERADGIRWAIIQIGEEMSRILTKTKQTS